MPRTRRGVGRPLDDDAVAERVHHDAEPAFDMGEVLVVMAEDEARPRIVLEGEGDLGRLGEAGGGYAGRRHDRRQDVGRKIRAQHGTFHAAAIPSAAKAGLAKRLFDPRPVTTTGITSPIAAEAPSTWIAWR